jgi:hypothetical protein
VPARDHVAGGGLDGQERAGQVHVDHLLPRREGQVDEAGRRVERTFDGLRQHLGVGVAVAAPVVGVRDPGCRHHHVEPAQAVHGQVDCGVVARLVGGVELGGDGLAPGGGDGRDRLLGRPDEQVGDEDASPLGREPGGARTSDAVASTGHERHLAGKPITHGYPSSRLRSGHAPMPGAAGMQPAPSRPRPASRR